MRTLILIAVPAPLGSVQAMGFDQFNVFVHLLAIYGKKGHFSFFIFVKPFLFKILRVRLCSISVLELLRMMLIF